jgi:hypothetical protein
MAESGVSKNSPTPDVVKTISTSSPPHHVEISAPYMYVSTDTGIEIYDITSLETPLYLAEIPTDAAAKRTSVDGNLGVVLTDEVLALDGSETVVEGERLRVFIKQ